MNEVQRRGALRRFVNRLEVDQAVFYSVCIRLWQFAAGPVSVLLIGTFFSPNVQGYFYTFSSLLALQSFFELGFQVVIINVASHEWSQLELDRTGRVTGEAAAFSRLVSLGRLLVFWYGAAAVLFAVSVGLGGTWFLGCQADRSVSWQLPWLVLVLFSALTLWNVPLIVLLEGCGQMAVVNRYRLYQAMSGSVLVWLSLILGFGLWTAVVASAVQVLWSWGLVFVRYRRFFQGFWRPKDGPRLNWWADLWPMQWRIAIGSVFGYFATNFLTPVMFHYHGSSLAGRMGMTWQLVTMLQTLALAWVQTRSPLFGVLVAKRDYRELDRVFFRVGGISLTIAGLGAGGLLAAIYGLNLIEFRLAARLLDLLPTALFLAAILLSQVLHCQAFYIRAHRREPLMLVNVVSCSLVGISTWWFGWHYGPVGAAMAYLAIIACVTFPWHSMIWHQYWKNHG